MDRDTYIIREIINNITKFGFNGLDISTIFKAISEYNYDAVFEYVSTQLPTVTHSERTIVFSKSSTSMTLNKSRNITAGSYNKIEEWESKSTNADLGINNYQRLVLKYSLRSTDGIEDEKKEFCILLSDSRFVFRSHDNNSLEICRILPG